MPKNVLILCTGNSCRSQMAEAFWRHAVGDAWMVASAGSRPAGFVPPLAIRVMKEAGLDISNARSKSVDEFRNEHFDVVVTVCDQANEECPVFPGAPQRLHWGFEDPARAEGSEQEKLAVFREARDAIRRRIERYLANDPK